MNATALVLRSAWGAVVPGDHWSNEPDAVDSAVLRRCCGPTLDIGCGPGRHVLALAEQGIPVLGIDLTPHVVSWARRRGALVLQRCVFARVPGAGRWKTALLLDGNIGIGADPCDLLRRVAQLLAPDGLVLVEVDPPGLPSLPTTAPTTARLEVDGVRGPWFAWTSVDADGLDVHAAGAGLATVERWDAGGRHFAELRRAERGTGP